MKIIYKQIIGFLTVILLILIVAYYSLNVNQKALQRAIGEESRTLTVNIMESIDKDVYFRIETFLEHSRDFLFLQALSKSNREFEGLDDIQKYIDEKDQEWISTPKEVLTDFMRNLLASDLSMELRRMINFYQERYGYNVFSEIFVTNEYGAVASLTGKTSDYRQDDERWWQEAQKNGLYIEDVEYDESSDVYSIACGIRIDDAAGDFLGVIKVILNIEEVINILKQAENNAKYKSTKFRLITKDGKLIYSTEEYKFLEDVAGLLEPLIKTQHIGYFIKHETDEGDMLFAHSRSKGFQDYGGLGWFLTVEHSAEEIFATALKLRNNILIILLIAAVLSILLSFFMSNRISSTITRLRDATVKIGEGDLDAQIDISSNDEIGQLAVSFKEMAEHLKTSTTSISNLKKEVVAREEAQKALKIAYQELKNAQSQLIQAEKLQTIGTLASGVAHEVKNPLAIILQCVEYLAKRLPKDDGNVQTILDNTKDAVDRADTIIKNLLDFSSVSKSNMCPSNLHTVIDNSLLLVKNLIIRHKIHVKRDFATDIPDIIIDNNKIEQVFINLFVNSINAMHKEGTLEIKTYLEEGKDKKRVLIAEVCDSGPGIKKDILNKVFEPFFTTKQKEGGTGLGLSIVRNIIELHDGEIKLQNREKGSGLKVVLTFKVT